MDSDDIEGFLWWHILKDKFYFLVIFQMFFLVCELYKSGRHITTYFGYGQCFIWEILVLAVMETARPKNTSFSNFL